MQESYIQLLNQNKITIAESEERTEVSFQRNLLYLVVTGTVGLGFLITGLLTFEPRMLFVSGTLALLCLISIVKKRNGRTIFIIDKANRQLIFPSNNRYESTTGIRFDEIDDFTIEAAGGEYDEQPINYLFAERANKPELLLTLKKGLKIDSPILSDLKGWLKLQLQNGKGK